MRRRAIVLTVAVAAAFLGITAAPVGAGIPTPATVEGDFECTEPGTFTVTWTIENLAGADGEVTEAVLSGAAEGDITDSFDPNPFDADDETIVGSSEVSGDTVGTVTLDITMVFEFKGPFEFSDTVEVELDGSCEAPPTTEESTTTTAGVAAAADVRPTFTG
jgi:hypothetical protein